MVGMGEHSYFGAGNGWNGYDHNNVMTTWMKDWPVSEKRPTVLTRVVVSIDKWWRG
jgi:hypothetical protein